MTTQIVTIPFDVHREIRWWISWSESVNLLFCYLYNNNIITIFNIRRTGIGAIMINDFPGFPINSNILYVVQGKPPNKATVTRRKVIVPTCMHI